MKLKSKRALKVECWYEVATGEYNIHGAKDSHTIYLLVKCSGVCDDSNLFTGKHAARKWNVPSSSRL